MLLTKRNLAKVSGYLFKFHCGSALSPLAEKGLEAAIKSQLTSVGRLGTVLSVLVEPSSLVSSKTT